MGKKYPNLLPITALLSNRESEIRDSFQEFRKLLFAYEEKVSYFLSLSETSPERIEIKNTIEVLYRKITQEIRVNSSISRKGRKKIKRLLKDIVFVEEKELYDKNGSRIPETGEQEEERIEKAIEEVNECINILIEGGRHSDTFITAVFLLLLNFKPKHPSFFIVPIYSTFLFIVNS